VLLHSREVERLAEIGRWILGQRYKAGACCRLGCKCRQDGGGLSARSNYGAIVAREEVDSAARFLQMASSLAVDADEWSGRRKQKREVGVEKGVFKVCLEVVGRGEALRKDWPVECLRGSSPRNDALMRCARDGSWLKLWCDYSDISVRFSVRLVSLTNLVLTKTKP